MYCCKRCHYTTDIKTNILSHLKRKNQCNVLFDDIDRSILIDELTQKDTNDTPFECEYCSKKFSYQSGKSRHKKSCKENPNNVEDSIVDRLEEKIKELEQKINNQNTTVNNITTNYNIQNNVQNTINFGKENVEFLADSFIRRCLFRAPDGVTDLTKKIHFNPDKPEYHNVTTTNKKDGFLEVFKNGKWVYDDKNKVLDALIKQSFDILSSHYDQFDDEIKTELSPTNFKRVDQFVESVLNQDKTIQNSLRKCLYLLILNNRHVVNKE